MLPLRSRPSPTDEGVLLVTRAPRLRELWHPVAFDGHVVAAPVARRLLGTPIVVWRAADGGVRAARDRCPHRWARLSEGTVVDGALVCPYHGWRFGGDGAAVEIPQLGAGAAMPPTACVEMLPAVAAVGMVWVCLTGEAAAPVPEVPELIDPTYRRIEVGVITYQTTAAAVIDNNTDATHVAFVHAGTFGAGQDPRIAPSEVDRTPFGIRITSPSMSVAETPAARTPGWRRSVTEIWLPFVQVSRMTYADGASHILVKGCCPVDDGHTEVHLSVLRNDVGDDADVRRIIEFELAVEAEDKAVLDSVPAAFPLDPRLQTHIRHDRPGLAYRAALRELLAASPPPRQHLEAR